MKTLRCLLLFSLCITALTGCAQIDILSVEKLSLPEHGKFYHPRLDESGKLILLTNENFKGLFMYNMETKALMKITDADGAGYSPVILWDGGTVLFIENEYIQNRRYSKLNAYNVERGLTELVEPSVRELTMPVVAGNRVLFKADGQLKSAVIGPALSIRPDEVFAVIENQQLVVYREDKCRILSPYDGESYIWPSVSPDGKRILAYAMGKGAFICTPEGQILAGFGEIEAPVWAGNDHIAGMRTRDDGHQITGSVIVMANISTGKIKEISPEGIIAMYPSVSAKNEKIAFQSPEGDVYIIQYHINKTFHN